MTKKTPKAPKYTGITPAYENGPGKPIIRNGCNFCGMANSHTRTCPAGDNPSPGRSPLDPI